MHNYRICLIKRNLTKSIHNCENILFLAEKYDTIIDSNKVAIGVE